MTTGTENRREYLRRNVIRQTKQATGILRGVIVQINAFEKRGGDSQDFAELRRAILRFSEGIRRLSSGDEQ